MLSYVEKHYLKRYLTGIIYFLLALFCLAFLTYSCDWDFAFRESHLPDSTTIYPKGITKIPVQKQKEIYYNKELKLEIVSKIQMTGNFLVTKGPIIRTSCPENTGIESLKNEIVSVAEPEHMDTTSVTNVRHIRALMQALDCIRHIDLEMDLDCTATELREASHYLGTITGSDVDERLLDRIFENFCVGK